MPRRRDYHDAFWLAPLDSAVKENGKTVFRGLDQLQAQLVYGALKVYEIIFACPAHCPALRHPEGECKCGSAYHAAAEILAYTTVEPTPRDIAHGKKLCTKLGKGWKS